MKIIDKIRAVEAKNKTSQNRETKHEPKIYDA